MNDLQNKISEQESRKKLLGSLLKGVVMDMNKKPKRKTTKKQVSDAKKEALDAVLCALRDHKRNIPNEWVNGFNSAISIVGRMVEEQSQ